jgi:hypothetical protein
MWNLPMRRAFAGACLLAVAAILPSGVAARTAPVEVQNVLPDGQVVGTASVSFLFWSVFDAVLWNANGRFSWEQPFALTLFYRRDFSAAELVESTIDEMSRLSDWPQERLRAFGEKLKPCMPNVEEGDRVTAVSPATDRIALYHNGMRTCALEEPGLRLAFFNIWLSEDSQFPDASRRLIGQISGADG